MMKTINLSLWLLVICSLLGCQPSAKNAADLIIQNARIWTAEEASPWAEAIAIKGDKILVIGTDDEMVAITSATTEIIDAAGKMVVPGFIDCHVHFMQGGFNLASVQLRDAATPAEFSRRIGEFAKTQPAGTWILGGDWDHELWGGELPRKEWIDSLTPEHPVWVNRLDGHMSLANSLALKAAGITAETKAVAGGEIVRDENGNPAGVLKDNAMALIDAVVPEPSDTQKDEALQRAMDYVAAQGVTTVHHMGLWDHLSTFRRVHERNGLKTRIYACVPLSSWKELAEEVATQGKGDEYLRIGGLKGFVDGSLGSHTARFLEPFTDAPNDVGLMITDPKDLYQWASKADSAGLQLMIHAIGDSAIRLQLDIFERVGLENGPRDRRFRIEHAQHIHPSDFSRFAALKVIPSMQPYHAIDDGRWAEKVIGTERIKGTYAFKSLLDAGAQLAFGSDWAVAPPTPLEGIYAALTRRTFDGANPEGWVPEQKITLEEALKAYTVNAAYASFEEDIKGSLQAGKLADLVVLDQDLFKIEAEKIRDVKVVMTIVGGKVVHKNK